MHRRHSRRMLMALLILLTDGAGHRASYRPRSRAASSPERTKGA